MPRRSKYSMKVFPPRNVVHFYRTRTKRERTNTYKIDSMLSPIFGIKKYPPRKKSLGAMKEGAFYAPYNDGRPVRMKIRRKK